MNDDDRIKGRCADCGEPITFRVARDNQGYCFDCQPLRESPPVEGMRIIRKDLDSDEA